MKSIHKDNTMVCVLQAMNTYRRWTQYHLYNIMKSNMTALQQTVLLASLYYVNPLQVPIPSSDLYWQETAVPSAHLPFRLDNEKFVELQDLCDQEYTSSTGSFKYHVVQQEMIETTRYCKCLSCVDACIRTR